MGGVNLSTAELALVTGDKPMLVGSNILETSAPSTSNVKWLPTNPLSGTSDTHASYPASAAWDRFFNVDTRPDTAGATWNFTINLGTHDPFDMIMIGGHNFGTITGLTVKFQLATDATFGSVTDLSTWSPGTSNKRLVSLVLSDTSTAKRWTTTPYIRVNITGTSGTPRIGELWLGRRRHLPYKFNIAAQEKRTRSEVVRFESRSGLVTSYTKSKGKALRSGAVEMDDSTNISDVTSWWEECDYGAKPFLWIENPATSPSNCHVMTCDTELDFDLTGPSSRALQLDMRESAPYLTGES